MIVAPAGSDWTECKNSAGKRNPIERLNRMRELFFGEPRSLGDIYDRFSAKLGSAGAAALPAVRYAAQSIDTEGSTVITGGGESMHDALAWASTALGKFRQVSTDLPANAQSAANLLRPTPSTARLAYMMLASMGA